MKRQFSALGALILAVGALATQSCETTDGPNANYNRNQYGYYNNGRYAQDNGYYHNGGYAQDNGYYRNGGYAQENTYYRTGPYAPGNGYYNQGRYAPGGVYQTNRPTVDLHF